MTFLLRLDLALLVSLHGALLLMNSLHDLLGDVQTLSVRNLIATLLCHILALLMSLIGHLALLHRNNRNRSK